MSFPCKTENTENPRGGNDILVHATRANYQHFGKRIHLLGLAFNAAQALLFTFLHVWPLVATYLIGLCALYVIMRAMLQSQRESKKLIICLWGLFLLQAFIAVWILGAAAGFQFYLLALLPFNFSDVRHLLRLKTLQVLGIIVFFLACDTWLGNWQPIYILSPGIISLLRHINTIGSCLLIAGISYTHSLAIKAAEDTLLQLASTDTLTGLLNRRRMTELADREQIRYQRQRVPVSVLLCDIDHFKHINDHFGHAAGDHVLQVIANLFLSTVREYDCVARWGGEEFMVLLPETGWQTAQQIAERLRTAAAQVQILFEEQTIAISITVGVAQVNNSENWHAAVARADEALYQGKTEGRNRVVLAKTEA